MVKTRSIYICEVCGEEYSTMEKAIECEKIPTSSPLFKVGDKLKIITGSDKDEIVEIKDWSYISPECMGTRFAHKVQYFVEFSDGTSRRIVEDILDYGRV